MTQEPVPPAEHDARAATFPEGMPDVAVGGVQILRTSLVNDGPSDDGSDGVHWHLTAVPQGDGEELLGPAVSILSDLMITHDAWFLGVTTIVRLIYRDEAPFDTRDVDAVNNAGAGLCNWSANVAWDVSAVIGRGLVAATAGCPIKLPWKTPAAHIGRVSIDDVDAPIDDHDTDEALAP